ncbi:hypothetical protein, variant 1 [Verruconis gallopava]|uniref:C2H2-type domain-containing protein n=1 Tax=Verruconis gallopava TaxID=253628 RepID=A0A0D2AT09_9PEZI|nr:hypothetical protein, variant 1 [Verruconis gallopava]KIW02289.1 hypothetical protein, variant 1 [Verruconis gallopava]
MKTTSASDHSPASGQVLILSQGLSGYWIAADSSPTPEMIRNLKEDSANFELLGSQAGPYQDSAVHRTRRHWETFSHPACYSPRLHRSRSYQDTTNYSCDSAPVKFDSLQNSEAERLVFRDVPARYGRTHGSRHAELETSRPYIDSAASLSAPAWRHQADSPDPELGAYSRRNSLYSSLKSRSQITRTLRGEQHQRRAFGSTAFVPRAVSPLHSMRFLSTRDIDVDRSTQNESAYPTSPQMDVIDCVPFTGNARHSAPSGRSVKQQRGYTDIDARNGDRSPSVVVHSDYDQRAYSEPSSPDIELISRNSSDGEWEIVEDPTFLRVESVDEGNARNDTRETSGKPSLSPAPASPPSRLCNLIQELDVHDSSFHESRSGWKFKSETKLTKNMQDDFASLAIAKAHTKIDKIFTQMKESRGPYCFSESTHVTQDGSAGSHRRRKRFHDNAGYENAYEDAGADNTSDTHHYQKRFCVLPSRDSGATRHLACPYDKHDTETCSYCRECLGSRCRTTYMVRQHLQDEHSSTYQCCNCFRVFGDDYELVDHESGAPCSQVFSISSLGIFGEEQQSVLAKDKYYERAELDRWREMHRLLFPGEPLPPYCGSQDGIEVASLERFRSLLTRALPAYFRAAMSREIAATPSDLTLNAELDAKIVDAVRTSIDEAYEIFASAEST